MSTAMDSESDSGSIGEAKPHLIRWLGLPSGFTACGNYRGSPIGQSHGVTWIGTTSVAGITPAMYDRRYHHSRVLLGPVSGLSEVYTTDTTTSI